MEILIVVIVLLLFLCFYSSLWNCEGFTSDVIKDLVKFNGRKPGTLDHYESHLYLLNKVRSLNVQEVSWAPGYVQKFEYQGIPHQNIVFKLPGKLTSPKIIVMAHYDHIGIGYPGGNDNGSGVFGLLKIAERLSHLSETQGLFYPILFILTDGEETGMKGSRIIFDQEPIGNVVINIDTIGGFPDNKPIPIASKYNYAHFLSNQAKKKNMDIIHIDIKPGRSDITHFLKTNICVEFGYPTKEGHYHSHNDTYENLYLNNMNKVIDLAGDLVEGLSKGYLSGQFKW